MSITANYGCFSLDVISAPTNKEKAPLAIWLYYHAKREPSFAIVLCTNMAVRLTTWLESTYWLTSLPCYTLSNRQGVRGISGGRFFSSYMWIFDQISNYCPMSETIKERFNWCQGQTSDPRFIFDKDSKSFLDEILRCSRLGWALYSPDDPVLLTCGDKVFLVSESCLYHVGIKSFLGKVSDWYRFLDFWQSRRLDRYGEKPLPSFCFGGNVIFPRK